MISEIHTHEDPILTREEAIEILNTPDDQLDMLIERAGILRKKYKGNRVSIHILTNVRSGNCTQDCAYCAQSCRSDADIDTYKWVDDDKLYNDNDFVNEYHLSRHCIGLSGMGFTDAVIIIVISVLRTPLTSVWKIYICFNGSDLKSAAVVSSVWEKVKKMWSICFWN